MFSCRNPLRAIAAAVLIAGTGLAAWAQNAAAPLPGLGRAATAKELAAWDIDVRPDFKGLPKGQGSVAQGQDVWESKCASCHGIFGESNEVFTPLVGGTTADDVKSGNVARLKEGGYPGRTTLMKVATISTLWDYIHRAMPWNAPKSLKVDEVYAVTAFLLNLGGVLPNEFVLSDKTIAEAQARMPNRNGMTRNHALWPGQGLATASQPDVKATACMKDCVPEARIGSFLPDFARNNHGNLAEQNRIVGAQHGVDTTQPPGAPPKAGAAVAMAAARPKPAGDQAAVMALLQKYACTACHGVEAKIVGPGFREVAGKYATRSDAAAYLAGKIQSGGVGIWGQVPMPAQSLSADEAKAIAAWLAAGAGK